MKQWVIVGLSQFLSDLVDAVLCNGDQVRSVLVDEEAPPAERDLPWAERLAQWQAFGVNPHVQPLAGWRPGPDDVLILGPGTPRRQALVQRLHAEHGSLTWGRLLHPAATVSRLADVGEGCFIGAGAVVAAGVRLGPHVLVNRSASIGHDCRLAAYARVQPRATLGGLVTVGTGATLGMAATVLERLHIGAGAFVAAGA